MLCWVSPCVSNIHDSGIRTRMYVLVIRLFGKSADEAMSQSLGGTRKLARSYTSRAVQEWWTITSILMPDEIIV